MNDPRYCDLRACPLQVETRRPPALDDTRGERLLALDGVCRHFEAGAGVQGVDLTVHRGEILGVCGASGCGKSTLLRLVAERETPTAGRIDRRFERLGMVFQEPHLLPWLSARDNVALVRRDHPTENRQAAAEALASVGLQHAVDQFPAQLSGGMRQRVGIARALAADPDLLLMDEPFSSLDYFTTVDLLELVRRRVLERDIAVVFVSHDVREVTRLCDRVVVMGGSPGRILDQLLNPLPHDERESRPGALARFEDQVLEAIRDGQPDGAARGP
ncbi:ABC transporter ATP-binding protein [Guyparkeria sp.]|uniref:ABC transporter ATP-binding protein n=1 Tax=Guyparkeria sp. TaxID=2035736 RepID=UPI00397113D4